MDKDVLDEILDFFRAEEWASSTNQLPQLWCNNPEQSLIGAHVASLRGLHERFELWIGRIADHALPYGLFE